MGTSCSATSRLVPVMTTSASPVAPSAPGVSLDTSAAQAVPIPRPMVATIEAQGALSQYPRRMIIPPIRPTSPRGDLPLRRAPADSKQAVQTVFFKLTHPFRKNKPDCFLLCSPDTRRGTTDDLLGA